MCGKSSKDGDPRLPDWALAIKGLQATPAPSLLLEGCLACFQGPQQVGLGKVAFGSGPHGQGLTGTAKCLLCPLDPLFPFPSEFFLLTQISTKTPLPLIQQSTSSPVSTGNTEPPHDLPLPRLPDCPLMPLPHTSSTAFCQAEGAIRGLLPAQSPLILAGILRDLCATRGLLGRAGQRWIYSLGILSHPCFPCSPAACREGGMPQSWEFWISDDPNSFGAMIQVSCTLFGNQPVGSPALHCPELPA